VQHSVLIVGTGSIGERHVRCFLATDRARLSFVEVREELRNEVGLRYPQTTAYADLETALAATPALSAAVIATPAPLHVAQATRLAGRGLHLLIEKPLGVSADGVTRLRQVVAERGVTASVAYVLRAHPVLAEMREAVTSGAFGPPVEVVAVCGQHFPTYRPAYRETYYTRHASGGGAVQDALTHIVNAVQWFVGPADLVVADLSHKVLDGTDVEDTAHVLARHGAVPVSYALNQHQAPNEVTITVVCAQGVARFENHANRWRSMTRPGGEWEDHAGPPLERDALFTRQAHQFLDAVEGTRPPACNLDGGAATLNANVAILDSARQGGWQRVASPG
jgi:predicted dehydrogenase